MSLIQKQVLKRRSQLETDTNEVLRTSHFFRESHRSTVLVDTSSVSLLLSPLCFYTDPIDDVESSHFRKKEMLFKYDSFFPYQHCKNVKEKLFLKNEGMKRIIWIDCWCIIQANYSHPQTEKNQKVLKLR